ncbi:Cytochrome P450 78A9 [Dichanthelium oligosanthes]|uniref:Cytochrome P450 78A9 n=1 Tax=Dichanthelium oligosanthes TaxID=888268 RepID=A0A1E5W1M1_9POAL|nr:Cytochrome P450 78A9 [Dichanthelium oligosanthes]
MAPSEDCGWLLYLSLAAKCGDPHRLLGFAAVFVVAGVVTALLHWAAPGGPAWGWYWWTRKGGLGIGAAIPGPRGLPVIGSMGLMTGLAHRKLAAAAAAGEKARRRLMAFSLGETRVVVTADPDVARELLASAAFADRPVKESAYGLLFHRAIGFAPHGAYWRALRRVASAHLFSPRQITGSAAQRAAIARQMVDAMMKGAAAPSGVVTARRFLKRASLHNVMWSVFGRRYELQADSEEAAELKTLVDEGYDLLGQLNWSDHLPWLARFDLQKTRARCSALVPRVNLFVGRIIDEHRARLSLGDDAAAVTDFTDVLLSLQGSDKLSDADMIAVLWEMIFRGTDTVAVLIEWVLARLVMHQGVQRRVHEELDRVVGPGQTVTESDTASLVYLQAVIKEVLRLHPPGPLLSWARLATSDVHVGGYLVPAGTTAMVNMWAITHDPAVWSDPTEFKPERFAVGSSDHADEFPIMGSDLRLAPFGSGRRSCPGKPLAMATAGFWLATLLHEFRWLPPSDEAPRGVDLSEVLRLSCEMAAPLEARLVPRRAA